MKIAVFGLGYVGMSNAVLLARQHEVYIHDIDSNKLNLLRQKISPIRDADITESLSNDDLNISILSGDEDIKKCDYLIVSTPTDYDERSNSFDTSSVESVIEYGCSVNPDIFIVIKSTVPIGFTDSMKAKFSSASIVYSPEFLREGHALYDNFYPSRIVVGGVCERSRYFGCMLESCAKKSDISKYFMPSREAECVKLFSNTYLALRVAYFNELDQYMEESELDSGAVIQGMAGDPRIGNYYNNPSFGYGGYCLPKDTMQLRSNMAGLNVPVVNALVESNLRRMEYIANAIKQKNPKNLGIYKLAMKAGSDNSRSSSMLGVIKHLQAVGVDILVYDEGPIVSEDYAVTDDLAFFLNECDLIVTNRYEKTLDRVRDKVYTRDITGVDL